MTTLHPSLTFSYEELVLIMGIFGRTRMPGMPERQMTNLDNEQRILLLGAAERNLRARRLLDVGDENKLIVDRSISVLVGPCIYPEFTIMATQNAPDGAPSMRYYHVARDVHIEHTISANALHTFAYYDSAETWRNELTKFFKLDAPTPSNLDPQSLEQKNVNALLQATLSDEATDEDVVNILKNSGASAPFAQAFAQAVRTQKHRTAVFATLHRENAQPLSAGYAYLVSEQGLWLLENDPEASNDRFLIRPIAPDEAAAQIADLYKLYDQRGSLQSVA